MATFDGNLNELPSALIEYRLFPTIYFVSRSNLGTFVSRRLRRRSAGWPSSRVLSHGRPRQRVVGGGTRRGLTGLRLVQLHASRRALPSCSPVSEYTGDKSATADLVAWAKELFVKSGGTLPDGEHDEL